MARKGKSLNPCKRGADRHLGREFRCCACGHEWNSWQKSRVQCPACHRKIMIDLRPKFCRICGAPLSLYNRTGKCHCHAVEFDKRSDSLPTAPKGRQQTVWVAL
ncbi:MAG: hypothetical protein MUO24_02375 [Desulfobacterales bacterium]|nr:hypothetical protein [Desulfobacterales bacterium]